MQETSDLYKRAIAYWFLLLIPLIAWGFYHTYFSVFFQPHPSIIHLHFALMMMLATMFIVQPLLIRYKKLALHRMIGKISYVVVPLLLITGFFLIRFVYYRDLNGLNLHNFLLKLLVANKRPVFNFCLVSINRVNRVL